LAEESLEAAEVLRKTMSSDKSKLSFQKLLQKTSLRVATSTTAMNNVTAVRYINQKGSKVYRALYQLVLSGIGPYNIDLIYSRFLVFG